MKGNQNIMKKKKKTNQNTVQLDVWNMALLKEQVLFELVYF